MSLRLRPVVPARGHTLLEVMLSLVLLSLVMASVTSAVIFASSANPDPDGREATLAQDSRVLNRIAEDLSLARYILEQSDHAVAFVVSDRTGDGTPDRIRYAWSGTYGDALTYQLNDEDPVGLIDGVAAFGLDYTVTTDAEVMPVAVMLRDETTLDAYTTVDSGSTEKVRDGEWQGQMLTTSLREDAIGFIPTRVQMYGHSKVPDDGTARIDLVDRGSSAPGSVVYASHIIDERLLSDDAGWNNFDFTGASRVPAGTDLALTFKYLTGSNEAIELSVQSSGLLGLLGLGGGYGGYLWSNDGQNWSLNNGKSLVYRLLGKEIVADTQQHTITRSRLTRINLSLQGLASGGRAPLKRAVRMMLAPPKLDAFAETQFDTDPTVADLDGDKTPDWSHSSGSFPAGSISGGIWTADGTLIFEPAGLSAAEVITLTARMRANDTLGPTIYGPYTINSSGEGLPVITQLRTDGQGGQELVVYNGFSRSDPYFTIPGLPSGLVDVGLTLIPDEDYLLIEVNHQPQAALILERVTDPGTVDQAVWLSSSGGVAAFGSAYIKAGGSYTTQTRDEEDGGLIGDVLDLLF